MFVKQKIKKILGKDNKQKLIITFLHSLKKGKNVVKNNHQKISQYKFLRELKMNIATPQWQDTTQ